MNAAYNLFLMIMTVIMCNYLIVWDNHHYLMGVYIIFLLQCTNLLMGWHRSILLNYMFSLKTLSIMVANCGTPSPTRPGHCQQLQLLNPLFLIQNLILTGVPFVNSCNFISLYQLSYCKYTLCTYFITSYFILFIYFLGDISISLAIIFKFEIKERFVVVKFILVTLHQVVVPKAPLLVCCKQSTHPHWDLSEDHMLGWLF